MLSKPFVDGKLKNIVNYLSEIETIIKLNKTEIKKDFRNIKTLERNFQLIVDEILDINLHFIRELNLKSPDDFQSTFEILAGAKILPEQFAAKFAPVVGMRNRVVHRYESVDKNLFLDAFQKRFSDFIKYIKLINKYLKNNEFKRRLKNRDSRFWRGGTGDS